MKIISWNIRGLKNPHKQDILRNLIRDNRPDILVIQETKMLIDKVENLSIFKGGKIIVSDSDGASGGMAIFWTNKWIQGELFYQGRNMMNVCFVNPKDNFSWILTKDNFSWILTNVYAPNSKWGRKALWEEISIQRKFFVEDNWLVIGDFNTPLKDSEKWGGSQTNLDNRLDVMNFIDLHLLHDVDLHGTEYTQGLIEGLVRTLSKSDLIMLLLVMTGSCIINVLSKLMFVWALITFLFSLLLIKLIFIGIFLSDLKECGIFIRIWKTSLRSGGTSKLRVQLCLGWLLN